MAVTKWKGQLAEIAVIRQSVERGYRVALPMNEDCPYDLVVERERRLERVQCKYTVSDGEYVVVRCRTSNKSCHIRYTPDDVDWIAVYEATSDTTYYVPATLLGSTGRSMIHLRLRPARNGQVAKVRWAHDFLAW